MTESKTSMLTMSDVARKKLEALRDYRTATTGVEVALKTELEFIVHDAWVRHGLQEFD